MSSGARVSAMASSTGAARAYCAVGVVNDKSTGKPTTSTALAPVETHAAATRRRNVGNDESARVITARRAVGEATRNTVQVKVASAVPAATPTRVVPTSALARTNPRRTVASVPIRRAYMAQDRRPASEPTTAECPANAATPRHTRTPSREESVANSREAQSGELAARTAPANTPTARPTVITRG